MSTKLAASYVLFALGLIGTLMLIIKARIIGFYDHEIPLMLSGAVLSIGCALIGHLIYRQEKKGK